jgi:hypothetical protein
VQAYSQPSAAFPFRSTNPALHEATAGWQVLAEQTPSALGSEHTMPQPPQLLELFGKLAEATSQPSAGDKLQSTKFGLHV